MIRADRKLLLRETTLPSIDRIEKQLQYADLRDQMSAIRMGYEMTYQIETSRYALFKPNWFIKRNGKWTTVDQATGKEG